MKKIYIFLFFFFTINSVFGQSRSISLELGGSSTIGSIGFEQTMLLKNKDQLAFRIGALYVPAYRHEKWYNFPVGVSYLKTNKHGAYEFGLGATYFREQTNLYGGYCLSGEEKYILEINNLHTKHFLLSANFGIRAYTTTNGSGLFWNLKFAPTYLISSTYFRTILVQDKINPKIKEWETEKRSVESSSYKSLLMDSAFIPIFGLELGYTFKNEK
jgi:hypothetical protein